jgi:hypothetical protein
MRIRRIGVFSGGDNVVTLEYNAVCAGTRP